MSRINIKYLKIAMVFLITPMLISSTTHKFYVSTTNVEYVKEKKAIQIITKIFTEDLEQALRARYGPSISLDSKKETDTDVAYVKKYLFQKLKITVDGVAEKFNFIGKEYDIDIIKVYFEIENISDLKSIEIENKVLFDMFPEQQNIIHLKTPDNRRSLILDKANPKGVLNFE